MQPCDNPLIWISRGDGSGRWALGQRCYAPCRQGFSLELGQHPPHTCAGHSRCPYLILRTSCAAKTAETLKSEIRVKVSLKDSRWQVRFSPDWVLGVKAPCCTGW